MKDFWERNPCPWNGILLLKKDVKINGCFQINTGKRRTLKIPFVLQKIPFWGGEAAPKNSQFQRSCSRDSASSQSPGCFQFEKTTFLWAAQGIQSIPAGNCLRNIFFIPYFLPSGKKKNSAATTFYPWPTLPDLPKYFHFQGFHHIFDLSSAEIAIKWC